MVEAAHKDARHAEWLLERQFPNEFAPLDRRPLPIEEQPRPPLLVTYPPGALEALLESKRKITERMSKLPKETQIALRGLKAPENGNGAPKVEYRYNQLTKEIEPIEPLPMSNHERRLSIAWRPNARTESRLKLRIDPPSEDL